jgi:signal transduction histidine kinase
VRLKADEVDGTKRTGVREAALAEDYAVQLERWLAHGGEESLRGACQLARRAIDEGLGVIDMSELHQSALERALDHPAAGLDPARAVRIAKTFLVETLLPFEMAHRASRESNATLRRLNERFENDAKRISHAIHAEAGQLLASAAIALERVGRELPEKRDELRQVATLLDEIHHELRRLSHELRPPLLDQLGLLPALRFLAEGVSERSGIAVRVYGELPARPAPQVEVAVYRIVQEALHNVVAHSGAARAMVRVWKDGKSLLCSVRDGGNGFDPRAATEAGTGRGLGLVSIRERLYDLGGTLKIETAPGRGTDLVIMIPTED